MQKWQKVLLITIFISAILGTFIGSTMTKSGIGEIKIWSDLDIFGFLELILLLISIVCSILDIYETYESKNEFGTVKFKIMIHAQNRLDNILISLVLITIFELVALFTSSDMHIIPLLLITIILTFMLIFHNRVNNGINENGILYCGIYHNWEDVKSYKFENETLLELNILIDFLWFDYNNIIKFTFENTDKEAIEKLLAERL